MECLLLREGIAARLWLASQAMSPRFFCIICSCIFLIVRVLLDDRAKMIVLLSRHGGILHHAPTDPQFEAMPLFLHLCARPFHLEGGQPGPFECSNLALAHRGW